MSVVYAEEPECAFWLIKVGRCAWVGGVSFQYIDVARASTLPLHGAVRVYAYTLFTGFGDVHRLVVDGTTEGRHCLSLLQGEASASVLVGEKGFHALNVGGGGSGDAAIKAIVDLCVPGAKAARVREARHHRQPIVRDGVNP